MGNKNKKLVENSVDCLNQITEIYADIQNNLAFKDEYDLEYMCADVNKLIEFYSRLLNLLFEELGLSYYYHQISFDEYFPDLKYKNKKGCVK